MWDVISGVDGVWEGGGGGGGGGGGVNQEFDEGRWTEDKIARERRDYRDLLTETKVLWELRVVSRESKRNYISE